MERDSRLPKETIGYHYNPGKKVFLISIEFKNTPGVLAEITSALSKAEVKTLSGFTAIKGTTEEAAWGFFAEAEADLRAQQLKRIIDQTPQVTNSVVMEGTGGLVVDTIHF